jgi:hypothetical protein
MSPPERRFAAPPPNPLQPTSGAQVKVGERLIAAALKVPGSSRPRGPFALRVLTPRETLANLSITGHLRRFSDQPVAEIVQCGEPPPKSITNQQFTEQAKSQ